MGTKSLSIQNASRSITGRLLWLFLPVAIIIVSGTVALYQAEANIHLTKIRSSEEAAIRVGTSSIRRVLQSLTRDLAFLAKQEALVGLVSDENQLDHDRLLTDWLVFSRTKGLYDQIRWLDSSGQERLRVNFNNGKPGGVPADKLQNKGKRYYFTDAAKLNPGEFFISPLDLNIERGKIEQPLKPMIRIGTPVFDRVGQKQGIVLLNYFGEIMLQEFGRVMGASNSRAWLLNRDGYWLKGPPTELEWGFMHQRPEASLAHRYPDTWKKILAAKHGQFENEHGLWTFATVYPLAEGHRTSTGTHEAFAPSRSDLESSDYFWKAVLLQPHEEYRSSAWRTGGVLLAMAATLLIVLFIGSWRLANAWKRAEVAEKELRQINLGLEQSNRNLAAEVETRKRTEVALHDAKEAAEAANKAKSLFLANMSHELRTPLNSIIGFSEIMSREKGMPKHQWENLNIIRHSGGHLLRLINDVLDMSKIEAGHMSLEQEEFDLGGLIRETVDMFQIRAEGKGLQLLMEQTSEFPQYIYGDAAKIRQIIINLVSNAIKFTDRGGVSLRLSSRKGSGDGGLILQIEVEDSGHGISLEDQARIFQPFEQLIGSSNQEGTGLGLAITRQFVEMMGGTIGLESTLGKGTLFRVDLSVKEASEGFEPELQAKPGLVIGLVADEPTYKVIVAEDQPNSALLLKSLLLPVGFDVRVAVNGQEAIDLFESWHPDFIWMDRRMPVKDGLTATREIRALPGGDKVKIAAVTASVFKEQKNEVLEAGCDDYVRKPYRSEEIYDCMVRQLGVRFQYEGTEEPRDEAVEVTPEALAALPADLVTELRTAAVALNVEQSYAIIERIGAQDEALAAALKGLVDDFNFPALHNLLKASK